MERRELFSSLASSFNKEAREESKSQSLIRPPYFKDESDFHKECINCDGKCSNFCEEHIIVIGEDKTPFLDFTNSGCTYCDECANACEYEVLNLEDKKQINAKISIDIIKCLSWNQTMCFSCKDPCLDDAIEFLGMFRPEIIDDKCTACGFCIKACPTQAIDIKIIEQG
ncbi:ferredoxin-type protein NapF [Arcobacter sp. LA11]|uniref:ferredoxin-type protein NapF n=1 Tax=Arcobacter sp. LA11 TaxID=1898176 RepID=UPI000932FEF9|nr:ferredoxin-type protein NapF [Arcobacter sp. LA11]